MKKFNIEIEEILQRVEEIEANDLEEAFDKARDLYREEEIVLEADDWKETNYREYRDQVSIDDIKPGEIIDTDEYGKVVVLEKRELDNQLRVMFRKLNDSDKPYVVADNTSLNKYGTAFKLTNGNDKYSIKDAIKLYTLEYQTVKDKLFNILLKDFYNSKDWEDRIINIYKDFKKLGEEFRNVTYLDFIEYVGMTDYYYRVRDVLDLYVKTNERDEKILERGQLVEHNGKLSIVTDNTLNVCKMDLSDLEYFIADVKRAKYNPEEYSESSYLVHKDDIKVLNEKEIKELKEQHEQEWEQFKKDYNIGQNTSSSEEEEDCL